MQIEVLGVFWLVKYLYINTRMKVTIVISTIINAIRYTGSNKRIEKFDMFLKCKLISIYICI